MRLMDVEPGGRLEHALGLLSQTALDVMRSSSVEDALLRVMSRCGGLGPWQCAEAWTRDPTTGRLGVSACWHRDETKLVTFRQGSAALALDVGIGLAGLAWERRGAVVSQWLRTDPRFRRSRLGRDAGLEAGVAIPVADGDEPLAVLTFFAGRAGAIAQADIDVVTTLASHLAAVLRCHRAELELDRRRGHDVVSGLPSREWFLSRVDALIADQPVVDGPGVAAMISVDIDQLRYVNDAHDVTVGDELIGAVSERLMVLADDGDVVASLGGGAFALLHRTTDADAAMEFAHDVHATVSGAYVLSTTQLTVTASLGVAIAAGATDGRRLLADAIAARNLGKHRGGNQVQRSDPEVRRRLVRRRAVEEALPGAIERREIDVHHQPVVDLKSGAVSGVEALARWIHPDLGPISPAEFVPIAEESGLICALGLSVLEKSLLDLVALEATARAGQDLSLTVNLSPRQLHDPQLIDKISVVLAASRIAPHRVSFELTETVLMDDAESSLRALAGLHGLGVHLAIDDFGTGYSSLTYLRRFPVSLLKVDRSFVAGMLVDADDRSIVRSVIELGHALGLRVVAEGVEEAAQHAALVELGCDLAQGYWFGRPTPSEDLARPDWDVRIAGALSPTTLIG